MTYRGELKNGTRHGQGEYVYENKFFKYVGHWEQGHKHGQGRFELKDGTVYEGEFKKGEICGKGTKKWPDGRIYEGYFEDGEANGEGIWIHPNGERCEGQWKNNKLHGVGKRFYANGDTYEGSFSRHLYHGEGKLATQSLNYEGQFDNGKFHGKGKLVQADGSFYNGYWFHGKKHGKGTFFDSLNSFTYDGEWNNGVPAKLSTMLQIGVQDTTIVLDSAEIPSIQVQCVTMDGSLVVEETGRPILVSLRSVSRVPSRKPKKRGTASPSQAVPNPTTSKEVKTARNVPTLNTEVTEPPPPSETALPSPLLPPPVITLSSPSDSMILGQNERIVVRTKNGIATFSELKVPQELEGDFQLVFSDDMNGLEPEASFPWSRAAPTSIFVTVPQKKKGRQ